MGCRSVGWISRASVLDRHSLPPDSLGFAMDNRKALTFFSRQEERWHCVLWSVMITALYGTGERPTTITPYE